MNIDKAIKNLKNNGYTIPNGNTYNESEKYTVRDSDMLANMCLVAASKSVEYKTDYALLAVDFTEIYKSYPLKPDKQPVLINNHRILHPYTPL